MHGSSGSLKAPRFMKAKVKPRSLTAPSAPVPTPGLSAKPSADARDGPVRSLESRVSSAQGPWASPRMIGLIAGSVRLRRVAGDGASGWRLAARGERCTSIPRLSGNLIKA